MSYAEHKARLAAVAELVKAFRDACTDWDGSQMADAGEPRSSVTCAQLRLAADEIDRLNTALAQAIKDMNEEIREAQRGARESAVEGYWQGRQESDGTYGSY